LRSKKRQIATPAVNENNGSPVAVDAFEMERDAISVKKWHVRNNRWGGV